MTSWDLLSKFILVGNAGVGKSSLLVQLTDQRFLADPDPTVGVEFGSYIVTVEETGERIKCQCWDTAGSEAFRSVRKADGYTPCGLHDCTLTTTPRLPWHTDHTFILPRRSGSAAGVQHHQSFLFP